MAQLATLQNLASKQNSSDLLISSTWWVPSWNFKTSSTWMVPSKELRDFLDWDDSFKELRLLQLR